jgi:alkylhydroperoxidase family enzyme
MPKNYDASLARQEDLIPARAACAVSSIQRMGYSFADSPSGGKPVRSREPANRRGSASAGCGDCANGKKLKKWKQAFDLALSAEPETAECLAHRFSEQGAQW